MSQGSTPRERRDDLRDALLAYRRVKARHYPHICFDPDFERHVLGGHDAAASSAKWQRGLEEACRDIAALIRDWSREAQADFLDAVEEMTGRAFASIIGDVEAQVGRLVRRKRQQFSEFELRLLRDYLSDGLGTTHREGAEAILAATGA